MRINGFSTAETEALARQEDDPQRSADDAGFSPGVTLPTPEAPEQVTVGRTGLPVRLIYRRRVAT